MNIYSVYELAVPARNLDERAASIVFVREGFTWWGFFLGPLWLLFNALWIEFLAAILLGAAFSYALGLFGLKDQAPGLAYFLLMLIIGFEGSELRGWHLERKGYTFIAPVAGKSFEACEQRFFDAWLPSLGTPDRQASPQPATYSTSWGSWPGSGAVGGLPGDAV